MTRSRLAAGIAGILVVPAVLAALFIAAFGWNWLRGPIERMATARTGRPLVINGDLKLKFGWPSPHLETGRVTFENPAWAVEKQMFAAEAVDIAVDLPQLLAGHIVLPEVRLRRPVIFLEQGSKGRKNWLLDIQQQDEGATLRINRLSLDQATFGFDDIAQKTRIRADLSTDPAGGGLAFTAQGQYRGLALHARGHGGPVLGLRDEATPYPLQASLDVGGTRAELDGTITSLMKFSAVDMHLALRGGNLAQLYPLLHIAFPNTRPYSTRGHIVHAGQTWRFEQFSGRIGNSDIAGSIQVVIGGKRPAMTGELVSKVLDFADLGPLIGARPGARRSTAPTAASPGAGATTRVLPDIPFKTEHWDSVDAEIGLKASAIRRPKSLPLENLVAHLSLRDALLKLDPLNFGVAGGQLGAEISLDGRSTPIQARARLQVRQVQIGKLFPTIKLSKNNMGQINGDFDLAGQGNSVGGMLASSNGKAELVVAGGKISKLMMEMVGLHLWEILQLKVSGDKLIKLRCGVADFQVKTGVLHTDTLVFDTDITTLFGAGSIDLGQEKLDLTLRQRTKNTSLLALRSPIHVGGSFASPDVQVAKGPMLARGLGAIALGIANPLLMLIPLIDPGPGKDSDCRQLVREARNLTHTENGARRPGL